MANDERAKLALKKAKLEAQLAEAIKETEVLDETITNLEVEKANLETKNANLETKNANQAVRLEELKKEAMALGATPEEIQRMMME